MEITSATSLDATTMDQTYDPFVAHLRATFSRSLTAGPLFTTDADGLFAAYLDAMPADRQFYNCHCCHRFLETYGGLVTIDADGVARPAMWDAEGAPVFFGPSVGAMARVVSRAKVTGVFLSEDATWGQPVAGKHKATGALWTHVAVEAPESIRYRGLLLTAGQAMAEKKEDRNTACRALAEFRLDQLEQVVALLESETLYRTENVLGPAKWLRDLQAAKSATKDSRLSANLVWRAVATAPPGFCHPRSSMIGTLLEDVAAGMDFATVSRRFSAKMHPLSYQRPQAAPSAGNIAEAEKVVEKLGIAPSLKRRFARLEDVEAIWRPKVRETPLPSGGIFGHLKAKGATATPSPIVTPPITITWEKFARTVLPEAVCARYYVPFGIGPFVALTTAEDPDAPPILQWDSTECRNPVAWYVYSRGSSASQWGMVPNTYPDVTAIAFNPAHWGQGANPTSHAHQGQGVVFLLDGCKDSRGEVCGGALFPETLKSELHGIRSTVEAYSRSATLSGLAEATACGIMLSKGHGRSWDAVFRVTKAGGIVQDYKLDRWD